MTVKALAQPTEKNTDKKTAVQNVSVADVHFELGCVDVKEIDGKLWFCARDVASAIEYKGNINHWDRWFDNEDKLIAQNGLSGQNRNMTYISEPALYRVLIKTDVPKGKPFERWVTNEVIPSIRKTGSYSIPVQPQKSQKEIDTEDRNSRLAEAEYWHSLGLEYSHNKTYKQIMDAYSTKALTGEFVLPLPVLEEKNYSATEVGKMLSVSATKIGMIANKLGIKVDGEYGKWYVDKARNSSKEVNTFRYTQKAVDLIKKELSL